MDVFVALADPVRRDLLARVAARPVRATDLAGSQTVSRPAVSRHLRVLVENGLVEVSQRGRERFYAMSPAGLAPVHELLDQLSSPPTEAPSRLLSDERLLALDTEVRRTVRDRRTSRPSASTQEIA